MIIIIKQKEKKIIFPVMLPHIDETVELILKNIIMHTQM